MAACCGSTLGPPSPTKEYIIKPWLLNSGYCDLLQREIGIYLPRTAGIKHNLDYRSLSENASLFRRLHLWPVTVSIPRIAASAQPVIDYNPFTLYLPKIFGTCDPSSCRCKFPCQFPRIFNAPYFFFLFFPSKVSLCQKIYDESRATFSPLCRVFNLIADRFSTRYTPIRPEYSQKAQFRWRLTSVRRAIRVAEC